MLYKIKIKQITGRIRRKYAFLIFKFFKKINFNNSNYKQAISFGLFRTFFFNVKERQKSLFVLKQVTQNFTFKKAFVFI